MKTIRLFLVHNKYSTAGQMRNELPGPAAVIVPLLANLTDSGMSSRIAFIHFAPSPTIHIWVDASTTSPSSFVIAYTQSGFCVKWK